jgi:two-component system, OmpR family, sensor histidine kinase KdpD
MAEDRTNSFLRMIRRSQRGRLKVYLGYSAGVGKTYQMLQEGHRLKQEGIDVVIGLLETHDRADIAQLAKGLEIVPRRGQEYHGVMVEEMDMDGVLVRKPQVALIDELAHTNVPGSPNPKRYQNVQDLLAAGIHVISTLNVQHLESLYNTVENAVGVKVRERLPDSVLAEADQIVDVDVSAEDLQKRLREGKIYPQERIEAALANFFKVSNLEKLRELALRELASQIDLRRREGSEEESGATPDQVMVCLSSRGPNSEKLLRYASRLAGKLSRNWYAVYVRTPPEEPTVIDTHTQQILSSTLSLAKQLGAIVFTYKGEDIVRTLLQFAKEYRVGHIVIGSPRVRSFWEKVRGKTGVVDRLIHEAKGVTVTVLDTREEESQIQPSIEGEAIPGPVPSRVEPVSRLSLPQLISPERVVIWNKPVEKEVVLKALVEKLEERKGTWDTARFLNAILEREQQGSTFFNEGVAFPHARIDGLSNSVVSLGLTRQGVSDEPTEKPIELVFLILSPAQTPDEQIKILALASRAAQNRHLRQRLQLCRTSEEVMAAVRGSDWEEEQKTLRPSG